MSRSPFAWAVLALIALDACAAGAAADPAADARAVAALDSAYQRAVKANNAAVMDKILDDDFTLVTGTGAVYSKSDLVRAARKKFAVYEMQDEAPGTQKVRVSGDTAVVTARLRVKGERQGNAFDNTLWFSDTYVRTPDGWRYFFGMASLPLPAPQ